MFRPASSCTSGCAAMRRSRLTWIISAAPAWISSKSSSMNRRSSSAERSNQDAPRTGARFPSSGEVVGAVAVSAEEADPGGQVRGADHPDSLFALPDGQAGRALESPGGACQAGCRIGLPRDGEHHPLADEFCAGRGALGVDGFYMCTQGGETNRVADRALFNRPSRTTTCFSTRKSRNWSLTTSCTYATTTAPTKTSSALPGLPGTGGQRPALGRSASRSRCARRLTSSSGRSWAGSTGMGILSTGSPEEVKKATLEVLQDAPANVILGADCTVSGKLPWRTCARRSRRRTNTGCSPIRRCQTFNEFCYYFSHSPAVDRRARPDYREHAARGDWLFPERTLGHGLRQVRAPEPDRQH